MRNNLQKICTKYAKKYAVYVGSIFRMFMQVMGRGVGGDFADGKNRRKHLPSDSENLRRPQAIQVQDYATAQARA